MRSRKKEMVAAVMVVSLVLVLGVFVRAQNEQEQADKLPQAVSISFERRPQETVKITPPKVGNAGLLKGSREMVSAATPQTPANGGSSGLIDQSGSLAVAAVLVVLAVGVVAGGRVLSTRRSL